MGTQDLPRTIDDYPHSLFCRLVYHLQDKLILSQERIQTTILAWKVRMEVDFFIKE